MPLVLRKGWVRGYERRGPSGRKVVVRAYWREHLKPVGAGTWRDLGLPNWESLASHRALAPFPEWDYKQWLLPARLMAYMMHFLPGLEKGSDGEGRRARAFRAGRSSASAKAP